MMLEGKQVHLGEIGAADRNDAQDMFDILSSPSLISGGTVTAHTDADGSVAIASGTGMIKVSNSDVAASKFFNFAVHTKLTLTNLKLNFVYVEYGGGTPAVKATTSMAVVAQADNVPLAIVYRDGNTVHTRTIGMLGANYAKRDCRRLMEKWGVERVSGTMISEIGTRNFKLTAGVNYLGCSRAESAEFDTSDTGRFSYWHYGGAVPAWVEVATQSQIDKTNYNDYGENPSLVALTANKYGVHWVYICKDLLHLNVVYGQDEYSSTGAEEAQPPANLPPVVAEFGMLVGKIITQNAASDDFVATLSPFAATFNASLVTEHNDLSALQGGIADEYYHLTEDKHTAVLEDKFEFTFQNGGAVLNTGAAIAGGAYVPFNCTITKAVLLADQSGSVVLDVWVDSYANYPPTVADTIAAAAKPTLSSSAKSEDGTLTGWTKDLTKGDFILPNIDSASTITQLKLILTVEKR